MVLPGRADDRVEFRRLVPADADLLVLASDLVQ
jgi:hypothetical protein